MTASAEAVRTAADARGLTTVQPAAVHLREDLAADHLHAGPTFADAVAPASGIACDLSPRDKAFVRPVPARTTLTEGGVR